MSKPHIFAHRLHSAGDELAAPAEAAGVAAPLAIAVFFLGWVGVGLAQAWFLARRGHDARTMGAIAAGLGPLMAVVTLNTVRTCEREARHLVIEEGVHGPGDIDVLIVVAGSPGGVDDLVPTLESISGELGRVTIAKVVAYEWVAPGDDNPVAAAAESDLRAAEAILPVSEPALVLLPGHRTSAVERFARSHHVDLVLHTPDDTPSMGQTGRR